jgi:hypothetical protein
MHGGAPGSGAPHGNKNALKHGLYTREAIAQRRQLAQLMKQSRKLPFETKWDEGFLAVRWASLRWLGLRLVFIFSVIAVLFAGGRPAPLFLEVDNCG